MAQTSLAERSVLAAQPFSRIKRRTATTGVTIDVPVSAASIFVGPDSDFNEYGVYYWDPATNFTGIQLATITAERPFVGRISANLNQDPPPLVKPTKARLVIVPEDSFDKIGFQGLTPIASGFINPMIDLIVANTERIPVVERRAEIRYDFALKLDPGGSAPLPSKLYYIPAYGRRVITVTASWVPVGVPFIPPVLPAPEAQVTGLRATGVVQRLTDVILPATALATAGQDCTILHYVADGPSGKGRFDYIEIGMITDGAFPGSNPENTDSGGYRMEVILRD